MADPHALVRHSQVKANVQKYQSARQRQDYKVKLKYQLAKVPSQSTNRADASPQAARGPLSLPMTLEFTAPMCHPHASQARVELQQCWQKLNHVARAQVVALIEQLENRVNAMSNGGALLAMVKQKTLSRIVQPKKTTPFDNVAQSVRKMSAQLKVIATRALDCLRSPCPAPAPALDSCAGCGTTGTTPRAAGCCGQRHRHSFPIDCRGSVCRGCARGSSGKGGRVERRCVQAPAGLDRAAHHPDQ